MFLDLAALGTAQVAGGGHQVDNGASGASNGTPTATEPAPTLTRTPFLDLLLSSVALPRSTENADQHSVRMGSLSVPLPRAVRAS